jgi:hypothetical protein
MMRAKVLMGSVAAVALATPALALPDRYEQGYSCTGLSGVECQQLETRLEDGNRGDEKERSGTATADAGDSVGGIGGAGDDDSEIGGEVGALANEAGDAAEEAGAEIGEAADEAGDAIGDAFD